MTTAVFFPGYNQCVGDLEHAPLTLLSSVPEAGSLIHFYRGSLNRDLRHRGMRHCCIGTSLTKIGYMADYLLKSFVYLRRHRISMIYCFEAEMAFLLSWAARFYRIPLILQVGVDWTAYNKQIRSPWKRILKDRIRRQVLKDAASVVTLAYHLAGPIRRYGRLPEVLYPFIEMEPYTFHPAQRGSCLQILFVGRLAPVKGARYLIDSLPLLLRQRRDFHLSIVGGSLPGRRSDEAYILRQIESQHLQDHVTLVGQVPHSRVVDYIKAADLVVMPSETEGFHYALLEAWACGVPVLATDIPFYREVVDKDTGRLCGFSPESMSEGLLEFLNMDRDELFRMKCSAWEKAEKMNRESRSPWKEFFKNRASR